MWRKFLPMSTFEESGSSLVFFLNLPLLATILSFAICSSFYAKTNTDQKVGLAKAKEQEFDPKHFKVILIILIITSYLNENEG